MKIFMATMGLDIGGAETHIVELAKQLKAQGTISPSPPTGASTCPRSPRRVSATTPFPCTGAAYRICFVPGLCSKRSSPRKTPTVGPRPRPHPRLFVREPAALYGLPLCHHRPLGL